MTAQSMLLLLAALLVVAPAPSQAAPVEVTNQDELYSAMQSEVEQIMVTQHIELDDTIAPPELSGANVAIWGSCTTPVDASLLTGVPPEYVKDGACSISAPGNTLFYAVGSKLWLSNLVLTGPSSNPMELSVFAWDSSVWMVDMVVVGTKYDGMRTVDSDLSIVDSAFVQDYNLPETFGLAVRFDVGEDLDTDNFFVSGSYFAASDWSSHAPLFATNMAGLKVEDLRSKSQIVNSEQDTVIVVSGNQLIGKRTQYGTCFGLCLRYSDGSGKAPTIYSDLPPGDYNQIENADVDKEVLEPVPTDDVKAVTIDDLTQVADDGEWLMTLEDAGVPGTDKALNPLGLVPPDPPGTPPKPPKPPKPAAPTPPGMSPTTPVPPGTPATDAPTTPGSDSTGTDSNTSGSPNTSVGPAPGRSHSKKSKPSVALIIVVIMASVVGCVAIVALAILLTRRRQRSYEKAHDEQMTWNSAASISTPIERAGYEASGHVSDTMQMVSKAYTSYNPIKGSSALTATADFTTFEHNVTITKRHIMGDKNVDVAAIKTEIHEMLDSYDARDASFQQYKFLPGFVNRREGGQGVVAFAMSYLNQHTWAVKFFAVEKQFNEERAMYENGQLRHVLPEVRDIDDNKDERLVAPNGVVVPPFIILACGQAFDEWCRSISPDFPLALQVLLHIAKKLQQIHAAGFAHRDVKPSNVILESQSKQWILIDYASAAPIGETCPVAYTLRYAAPEVARAVEENRSSMEVCGAVDVWALGIMAWTLLTGTEPFAGCQTKAEIFDKIMGRSPLPWETNLDRGTRGKLGILFPSIRAMLARDPQQRASIPDLLNAWQRLFQSQETTTQTTSHHAGAYR